MLKLILIVYVLHICHILIIIELTRDNSKTGYNSQTNAKLTGLSLKSITKIPGPLTVPWFGTIWTTPHKTDLVKLNECKLPLA